MPGNVILKKNCEIETKQLLHLFPCCKVAICTALSRPLLSEWEPHLIGRVVSALLFYSLVTHNDIVLLLSVYMPQDFLSTFEQ